MKSKKEDIAFLLGMLVGTVLMGIIGCVFIFIFSIFGL